MRAFKLISVSVLIFILFSGGAYAKTIDVGSGYTYSNIASGLSAATAGDYVHVHPGTYTISSSLIVPSGVTLYGDGYNTTTILAADPLDFYSDSNPAMIYLNGKSDVTIYGFTFNGGGGSLSEMHEINNDYRDYCSAIKTRTSTDVTIHDCYFTLTYGDSIRSSGDNENVYVYNCIFNTPGHDGLSMYYGTNWRMSNCIVNTFINAGMRFENVEGAEIDHCTFYSDTSSGSGGVEGLRAMGSNIRVHHNLFRNMNNKNGDGIFFYSPSSGSVNISYNVMYDIPGTYIGTNFAYTGSGNILGASPESESYWVGLGYGYNAAGVSGGTSTPTKVYDGDPTVTLTSPNNGASIPTANGNVSFSWSNVNSTSYRILVATDSGFTSIVHNKTTSSAAISLALNTSTTYYWKVSAYNDVGATWTAYTSSRSFTTTGDSASPAGVYGIVYKTSTTSPIQGAVVTFYNDSWSGTTVTGEDGRYTFSVYEVGTYYISASATDYQSSLQIPVNVTTATYIERNIALVESPSYFAPHNVKFIITDNLLRERYNANVTVYKDTDTSYIAQKETGTDGSVTFDLDEKTRYRIETVYGTYTQIDYIMPSETMYYIIIDESASSYVPRNMYDFVSVNVTKAKINATAAYINVTYTDLNINMTNSLTVTLGQHDVNGTYIPTGSNQTFTGAEIIAANGNVTASFIVYDYIGQSYTEKIDIDHDTLGVFTKWHADVFEGSNLPFDGKILAYFGVFILFIVAMQFGRAEHATGAILLCGMFWFMYFASVFKGFGEATTALMLSGGSLATVYAIVAYINDKRREEGI